MTLKATGNVLYTQQTDRLSVVVMEFNPDAEKYMDRLLFVGFPIDQDWPFPLVWCVTSEVPAISDRPIIDWVETSSCHRRRGYARDILSVVKQHYPGRTLKFTDGVTFEGVGFYEAMPEFH